MGHLFEGVCGAEMGSRGGVTKQAMLFNKSLLQYLACPLSKEPLRYCEKSQELVSDTIGVAYPDCDKSVVWRSDVTEDQVVRVRKIIDGIPCLIPMRGRILERSGDEPSSAK